MPTKHPHNAIQVQMSRSSPSPVIRNPSAGEGEGGAATNCSEAHCLWLVGGAVKRLNNNNVDNSQWADRSSEECIIRGLVNKSLRSPDDIYLILKICTMLPSPSVRKIEPLAVARFADLMGSEASMTRTYCTTILFCTLYPSSFDRLDGQFHASASLSLLVF